MTTRSVIPVALPWRARTACRTLAPQTRAQVSGDQFAVPPPTASRTTQQPKAVP
jgi:hypothetical protein